MAEAGSKLPLIARTMGGVTIDGVFVSMQPSQVTLLIALAKHRGASCEVLIRAVWGNPDREPDSANKMISVYVYHLRRRLRAFGLGIKNVFAVGYELVRIETDSDVCAIADQLKVTEASVTELLAANRLTAREFAARLAVRP